MRFNATDIGLKKIPSSNSRLAPPPVLTWLTFDSVPHLAQQVAVSPPPITDVVPLAVASTTAFITVRVPWLNLLHSKTPIGLQQKKNLKLKIRF